jgi:hypothetical protein
MGAVDLVIGKIEAKFTELYWRTISIVRKPMPALQVVPYFAGREFAKSSPRAEEAVDTIGG